MSTGIIPRAHYLTAQKHADEAAPLQYTPELVDHLPTEVTALTGKIRTVHQPEQGVCNLALALEAENGTFLLKIAQGGYRSQELWAEHMVMQSLHGGPVPVPESLAYIRRGALSYQLRAYIPGQPLNAVLRTDESIRPKAIRQMGETLHAIHAIHPDVEWTWDEWLAKSLDRAGLHLATGVYDPTDFGPDLPPPQALQWLQANRPAAGSVCLLHGDYRPKNLMWAEDRVVSVIDWAFADLGDPYYDLSIFRYYMRDQAEWALFLGAYGLTAFDHERFRYNMVLHCFLNV